MALPDDIREKYKWKPGDIPNPKGNHDRHSTRPIAKRIAELFEERIPADFQVDERFKSKKAKDALVQAIFEKALMQDIPAAKLLMEHSEGKEQSIDLTTKGEKIQSADNTRLNELLDSIKNNA